MSEPWIEQKRDEQYQCTVMTLYIPDIFWMRSTEKGGSKLFLKLWLNSLVDNVVLPTRPKPGLRMRLARWFSK